MRKPLIAVLACLTTACQGEINGGSSGAPGAPDTSATEASLCGATAVSTGWGPLRRVSHEEYDSSLKELLATTRSRSDTFPDQPRGHGFTSGSALQAVGELQAEGYFLAAEAFATEAVQNLPALLQCDVASVGQAECGKRFVDRFTTKAFRRPLTAQERADYQGLFTAATTQLDFSSALEVVIAAVLQSPHFLYHVERGVEVAPGIERLDGHTIAARLATSLWQSLPDETLTAAAASGELATREGIEAQARRMMADPRARPVLVRLFVELIHADDVPTLGKDDTRYRTWSSLRLSMAQETNRFFESVLFDGPASPEALLTTRHTFVDAALASHYGLPPVTGWQRVSLEGTPRLGVLTQGSFLSVFANPNQSSPVARGHFIRKGLLCQTPPPPPENAAIRPPDIKPGVPTRQRYAEHAENPACSGCHALMDPIGLGFEHFDAIGAWRARDEGMAVDATGEIVGTDVSGAFVGVDGLAARLAKSEQVAQCFGAQAFQYYLARPETDADACSLEQLKKKFPGSSFDFKEVVVALTTSDSFRHRKAAP
jgi:hypothetical protein